MRKIIVILCAILSLQANAQCWESISAGAFHTIAIKQDFTLWGWGANNTHQLGIGDTINKKTPVLLDSTGSSWFKASAGYGHTIALKQNKTLWAWGWNKWNQLGDNTTINKTTPIQIGTDSNWQSISTGYSHSIAIKSDGTLWAWGLNSDGQLGDSTVINKSVPTQIGTDTNWQSISTGYSHSMAIKSDGTLWAWGRNNFGQLGNGTTLNKNTPTQIDTNTDWLSISLGDYHSIALKQNGTMWAWGRNANGAVGDGTNTNKITPVQIGTASNWINIETGGYHSMAIKSDGTLWTWGLNTSGQLGDGTSINKNIPSPVNTNTTWQTLSAGEEHSIAIKQNFTIWAWGLNNKSQLGNDNTINQLSPIVINAIVNISVCQNTLPYTWNGQTFTTNGIYNYTILNSNGCDSVTTLHFTVLPNTTYTSVTTACSYTLPYLWNGQTINSNGIYTYLTTNSNGCDSTAILNFTITLPSASTTTSTECAPYLWNGQTITTNGIYNATLINSSGCDSVATLNLTLKFPTYSNTIASIPSNALPFTWNGLQLLASGLYTYTSTGFNGCDSIATLNLTVIPNGVIDYTKENFSVYPNPADNQIHLKVTPNLLGISYNLYNYVGQTMSSGIIKTTPMTIDISNLSTGIYLLSVGKHHKQSIKIVH